MLPHQLPGGCVLRAVATTDAQELFDVVQRNRDHLAQWLPWVPQTRRARDIDGFLTNARRQQMEDRGFQAAITDAGAIIGVVGFHDILWAHRSTSIGYWLAADHQGRGTMTQAVAALVNHAFRSWALQRVEIRAAVENTRSRAIPTRLGFQEEGVLRSAERLSERYVDLVVYGMLAPDWTAVHIG